MFFRFVLLGICLTFVLFFIEVIFPKLKSQFNLHKEQKNKKQNKKNLEKKWKN